MQALACRCSSWLFMLKRSDNVTLLAMLGGLSRPQRGAEKVESKEVVTHRCLNRQPLAFYASAINYCSQSASAACHRT